MKTPTKLALSLAVLACSGVALAQQPAYDPGMAPPPEVWDGGYGPGYGYPQQPGYGMPMNRPMGNGPMGMGPGYGGGPGYGQGPRMGGNRMPCDHGGRGMHRRGMMPQDSDGADSNGADSGAPAEDFHTAHMQQMKERLGISDDQKEAWESYQSTMDKLHQEMRSFMDKMHEERADTENPYAVQAKVWDFRKQHQESMSKARHELMKKLTPEQAEQMGGMYNGMGPRW